ncbi:putative diphthamide synthesis protein-domain-containing protein [Amanita rubescens]|nr:putative diphthamide synthesis protein-domain-containing protein [Amanita rubescens]
MRFQTSASRPRKRFIPDDILHDENLNASIRQLPSNYSFEVHKTIHHIRKNGATTVGIQMPEGLQMFACTIADIIEQFTNALTIILGDVTYGACCVDDYTALSLGCDMLVHYGHSCLVPIDQTRIKTLYVFVEISIDSVHLEQTVRSNLPSDREAFRELLLRSDDDAHLPVGSQLDHLNIEDPGQRGPSRTLERTRLALVSTIQFAAALQHLKEGLSANITVSNDKPVGLLPQNVQGTPSEHHQFWAGNYQVTVPRSKPLSPGEVLGCTAPRLSNVDAILYIGDGRFHLESIMIANPTVPAFRYDPYAKKLTLERYNHLEMQTMRNEAVESAKKDILACSQPPDKDSRPAWGVILGTLGRQGNLKQLQAITKYFQSTRSSVPYIQILLSEISPAKLSLFNSYVSVFVQTSCPRLSIDWGYAFDRPLLSPYETAVAVGVANGWMDERKKEIGEYPMDFYAGGSPWATARLTGSIPGDVSL